LVIRLVTGSAAEATAAVGDNGPQAPGGELTKKQHFEQAKAADIPGRSLMSKEELAQAIEEQP
jgi:hypothetical protein